MIQWLEQLPQRYVTYPLILVTRALWVSAVVHVGTPYVCVAMCTFFVVHWLLGYHATEHIITRLPFGQNNLGISEATTIALLCTLMELCIGNVDNTR